mmetsp:Transcript_56209/g.131636  ORF Transcript_56209/g.131636 Transcript_56209/m.131636 type:complete len:408 (+) Transcript_56209:902-2125(+)
MSASIKAPSKPVSKMPTVPSGVIHMLLGAKLPWLRFNRCIPANELHTCLAAASRHARDCCCRRTSARGRARPDWLGKFPRGSLQTIHAPLVPAAVCMGSTARGVANSSRATVRARNPISTSLRCDGMSVLGKPNSVAKAGWPPATQAWPVLPSPMLKLGPLGEVAKLGSASTSNPRSASYLTGSARTEAGGTGTCCGAAARFIAATAGAAATGEIVCFGGEGGCVLAKSGLHGRTPCGGAATPCFASSLSAGLCVAVVAVSEAPAAVAVVEASTCLFEHLVDAFEPAPNKNGSESRCDEAVPHAGPVAHAAGDFCTEGAAFSSLPLPMSHPKSPGPDNRLRVQPTFVAASSICTSSTGPTGFASTICKVFFSSCSCFSRSSLCCSNKCRCISCSCFCCSSGINPSGS